MSFGSSSQDATIGYKYYIGMHCVLCHGPPDALLEIYSGERLAWSGNVTASTTIQINAPELFGGDQREGGMVGPVDVEFGTDTQGANAYLLSKVGSPQPAYRGVLGMVFRQTHMISNNPYLKPLAFVVQRSPKGWNEGEALIGTGANPSHIIREALTNVAWGMGYPAASIDDATFATASTVLIGEGFGLHFLWTRQTPIREFIQLVLDHIGGLLTVSPLTGKFQLKLIRKDYDSATLPVIDESVITALESYQRSGWGDTVNEVTVVYTRVENYEDAEITVQDLGSVQQQGPVAETKRYPGIQDPDLAARVAMRDLTALSRPLAGIRIRANRETWALLPGDPFRFAWADLGIVDMVMRVVSIDTGTLQDGAISIQAIEDTFAFEDNAYTEPEPVGWTDPVEDPADVDPRNTFEVTYWDLSQSLPQQLLDDLDALAGFLSAIGGRPTGNALNYRLETGNGITYTERATGTFAPHCVLLAALRPEHDSDEQYFSGGVDLDLVTVGRYALIEGASSKDHEFVQITALDLVAGTVSMERGLLDTVPARHDAGARLWFAERFQAADPTEYTFPETVTARLVTRTTSGTLDPELATPIVLQMAARQSAPYAPGRLRINGQAYPLQFGATLTVSWAHRDRLTQTANYPNQNDGNIGPESGVDYTLRIYGETGTLQRTFSGISGTSQAYTVAEDIADNGLGRASTNLTIELEARRLPENAVSWQAHRVTVFRAEAAGYGLQWGLNYGGEP